MFCTMDSDVLDMVVLSDVLWEHEPLDSTWQKKNTCDRFPLDTSPQSWVTTSYSHIAQLPFEALCGALALTAEFFSFFLFCLQEHLERHLQDKNEEIASIAYGRSIHGKFKEEIKTMVAKAIVTFNILSMPLMKSFDDHLNNVSVVTSSCASVYDPTRPTYADIYLPFLPIEWIIYAFFTKRLWSFQLLSRLTRWADALSEAGVGRTSPWCEVVMAV